MITLTHANVLIVQSEPVFDDHKKKQLLVMTIDPLAKESQRQSMPSSGLLSQPCVIAGVLQNCLLETT